MSLRIDRARKSSLPFTTRRKFLKATAAAVTGWAGTGALFGLAPKTSFTLSREIRQPVTGWGCFPGWVAWDEAIGASKMLQEAIYRDLGMTVARVPIMPEYANRDGSLNMVSIDKYLVRQLETMRDYGITKWIVTTWSPPTFMKTIDDARDTLNGETNHLKPECEDAFVKYYAQVLAYLRDKRINLPIYAALQNEPDAIVTWPGCVYPPDQWRRVMKKFRKALDGENLHSIKIHATDHNHDTLRKFFGPGLSEVVSDPELLGALDGIALHSYNEGTSSGGAAAIDARAQIQRFKTELKTGSETWITENCTTIAEDLTDSAIRHLRSMMRDIGYLESNCYMYWLGSSDKGKFVGEELIYSGTKTKLYFVYQKLWHTVVPGSFAVRTFVPSDDPDFNSFGPDPMDILAFSGRSKTVVLLTNSRAETRQIRLKGLPGTRLAMFRTSDREDMALIGSQAVIGGESDVVSPGRSILMLEANGGIKL